jgi:hypothetical protein
VVDLDRAAQAAQHVGHQRDVEDLRAVGERRGALGEQGRGHELEHAVLRPDDVHRADQPAPRRHREMLRHGRDGIRCRPAAPRRVTVAAMAVHLTRIYTKTGDDGTTALGDFSRVRKTDVRLAAYADTDEATRRSASR